MPLLRSFVWEEVLDMITRMPNDMWEAKNELAGLWIVGVQNIMIDQEIGIKKVLDMDVTPTDVDAIFKISGYAVCLKCNKVVEDDHKHLWESSG